MGKRPSWFTDWSPFLGVVLGLLFSLTSSAEEIPGVLSFSTAPVFRCGDHSANSCPEYLSERLSNLTEYRMGMRSPYQRCEDKEEFNTQEIFKGLISTELDREFFDHDILSAGSDLRSYTSEETGSGLACFRRQDVGREGLELYEAFMADAYARCETAPNPDFCRKQYKTTEVSQNTRSIMVADNYLSHLKLRTGLEESMRSMNLIGQMYDEEGLSGLNCDETPYPVSGRLCHTLKADTCQTKQTAKTTLEQKQHHTKLTMMKLRELQLEIDGAMETLEQYQDPLLGIRHKEDIDIARQKIQAANAKMTLYKTNAPWVEGEEFKKFQERMNQAFESGNEEEFERLSNEALKTQMLANRENLLKQANDFQKAAFCLRGAEDCDREDTDKIIATTPKLNLDELDIPNRDLFKFTQCLEEEAVHVNFNENLVGEIILGAGLTIASFVVPPLGIARVAQLGTQVVRGASGISRLRGAGGLVATAGVAAADVMFAAQSFEEAVNQCSSESTEVVSFNESASPIGEVSCQRETGAVSARVSHIPNSCMSSILFASLDAIPFAAFATSSAMTVAKRARAGRLPIAESAEFPADVIQRNLRLNDTDRLEAARRLGITTTPSERADAILRSHNHFGPRDTTNPSDFAFGSQGRRAWLQFELGKSGDELERLMHAYTQSEIAEKSRILGRARFSPEERRLCLASGVCGNPSPGPTRVFSEGGAEEVFELVRAMKANHSPGSCKATCELVAHRVFQNTADGFDVGDAVRLDVYNHNMLHYHIRIVKEDGTEGIIDPTVYQFFNIGDPDSMPIFTGSKDDLIRLIETNRVDPGFRPGRFKDILENRSSEEIYDLLFGQATKNDSLSGERLQLRPDPVDPSLSIPEHAR